MSPYEKYMAMQAAKSGGGMGGGAAAPMPAPMGGGESLLTEGQEDTDYAKSHPVASGAALGPEAAQMQQMGNEQDEGAAIKALLMRLGQA